MEKGVICVGEGMIGQSIGSIAGLRMKRQEEDKRVWKREKEGRYTIKSPLK